jgi:hypothetical protein
MFEHIGRYIALVVVCAAAGFGGAFLNTGHTGAPGARGPAGIAGPQSKPDLSGLGICVTVVNDNAGQQTYFRAPVAPSRCAGPAAWNTGGLMKAGTSGTTIFVAVAP